MVFCDYRRDQVLTYNPDALGRSTIDFTEKEGVYGVAVLDETHFALSNAGKNIISIVDINTSAIVKAISTDNELSNIAPLLITYQDGAVIFIQLYSGIRRLNLETKTCSNVISDEDVDF